MSNQFYSKYVGIQKGDAREFVLTPDKTEQEGAFCVCDDTHTVTLRQTRRHHVGVSDRLHFVHVVLFDRLVKLVAHVVQERDDLVEADCSED